MDANVHSAFFFNSVGMLSRSQKSFDSLGFEWCWGTCLPQKIPLLFTVARQCTSYISPSRKNPERGEFSRICDVTHFITGISRRRKNRRSWPRRAASDVGTTATLNGVGCAEGPRLAGNKSWSFVISQVYLVVARGWWNEAWRKRSKLNSQK